MASRRENETAFALVMEKWEVSTVGGPIVSKHYHDSGTTKLTSWPRFNNSFASAVRGFR